MIKVKGNQDHDSKGISNNNYKRIVKNSESKSTITEMKMPG